MENNEQIDDEVELLADSVESLVGDKSLAGHSASKELSMAIALKNSAHQPELSPAMDQRVEGLLLARLKKGTEPQKLSFWKVFFGTSLAGALALAGLVIVLEPFSHHRVKAANFIRHAMPKSATKMEGQPFASPSIGFDKDSDKWALFEVRYS
jgi:hypothetical protein